MIQFAQRSRPEKLPTVLLVLLVVSLMVHLVVFIAPSWYSGANGQAGLWRWCTYSPPACHNNLRHHNDSQKGGSAMMVISLAGLLLGTISCVIYNCGKAKNTTMTLQVIGLFVAAACSLLALVLWGYDFGAFRDVLGGRVSLRWAYLMAICSCVLTTAVGMMAIFTLHLSGRDGFESKRNNVKYSQDSYRWNNQSFKTSPQSPRIQEETTAQHAENVPGRDDQASRKRYQGHGLKKTGQLEGDGHKKENLSDEDCDTSPEDAADKVRQHSESEDDLDEGNSEGGTPHQHKKTHLKKQEKKKTKKKALSGNKRRKPENPTPVYNETPENC